jgi:hypothetical protein
MARPEADQSGRCARFVRRDYACTELDHSTLAWSASGAAPADQGAGEPGWMVAPKPASSKVLRVVQ